MSSPAKSCKWCGESFPLGVIPFHVIKCSSKFTKSSTPVKPASGDSKSKKKHKKDKSKKKRKKNKSKIKFQTPVPYDMYNNEEEYHNGTSEHLLKYVCKCGKQFGLFDHANSHARKCTYHHAHNTKMDTNFIDDS